MTVAVEPKIYKIPGTNLAAFAEKLRALSKRSKKIGMPGVGFTMLSTETETTKDHEIVTYHYVTLSGEMPRVSGWEILGYLERCGSANLINTREGVEIPEEHRYEMRCDHCGVNRERAKTYVLRNVITGDVRQVGTTCLQDFVGSDTIDDAAAWFEMILEAESSAGMSEIESYGGNQDATYALPAFLAHVSATMRAFGWVSGSDAYNDYRKTSTAEEAWLQIGRSKDARKGVELTPEDWETGGKAILWATGLSEDKPGKISEYEHNLITVANAGTVTRSTRGYAASMIPATQRDAERKAEAATRPTSEFFGEEGKRYDLALTLEFRMFLESDFGQSTLHKLVDSDGNVFVWFASNKTLNLGETYNVRGTVKRHETRNGVKQTILTRCKVVKV